MKQPDWTTVIVAALGILIVAALSSGRLCIEVVVK